MVTWLEIKIFVDPANVEQILGLVDALGYVGTAQRFETDETVCIIAYLPSTEDVTEKLVWLQEQLDYAYAHGWIIKPASVTTKLLDAEDWETPLRNVLPPLLIGQKFLVILTDGEIESRRDRIVLRLRSLGGFGTGHHPTTRMCLEFLEKAMEEDKHRAFKRVLDVGTGSGILAIAAAKLGAKEIIATDIDDAALEAAKENARRNQVEDKINFVKSDLLRQVKGQFDIVLSNLLTPLIKDLAWQLKSRKVLNRDSFWIASGISRESWKEVKPLLAKLGYRIVDEGDLDGWVAFKAQLL